MSNNSATEDTQNKEVQKVKRPDVAARLIARKNIVEKTVKTGLNKRLAPTWNPVLRTELYEELSRWILSTSKVTHRLSLVFNRILLFCLNRGVALPSFTDAFFTATALAGMKVSDKQSKDGYGSFIEDFVEEEFEDFPKITRQRGDCQAIVIAARRYKTNFLNSCFVPFFQRQKAFIRIWCEVNKVDDLFQDILWKINGWKVRGHKFAVFPDKVNKFINEQRELLGNPSNLTEKVLKRKIDTVVNYYFHILTYYTSTGRGNKFSIAPVCSIKCHYLTVDDTVLRELLTNVYKANPRTFPSHIAEVLKNHEPVIESVWKEIFNFEGLRSKKRFGHQIDTDGVSICFHFQCTKKSFNKANKRRRLKRQKNKRVVAIDPGRCNIITAYDTEYNEYHRLTRQQYYRSAGMKNRIRKSQMRREDFRVYCLKHKCLDRFFNKFVKDGKKPIVAYGAASMNPTGKGELSVPVKYVYDKCCQRFHTQKENEEYSTKMHFECQQRTAEVKSDSSKTVRGLRWCPTCRKLVSRDKNACLNISASFQAETRPKYLCRTTHIQENTTGQLPARRLPQRSGTAQRVVAKTNRYPYNGNTRLLARVQLYQFGTLARQLRNARTGRSVCEKTVL